VPWYSYSATPSGAFKPLVVVRLWHGNRQVRLTALVDSGADSSLLDIGYADLLGLDRADATATDATGADGDTFEVFKWPDGLLELQFETQRFAFEGAFYDLGAAADGENLMGRADFFSPFIIQFWDVQGLMNIDLSPDFAVGDASTLITK
jgi:hypothetical protein